MLSRRSLFSLFAGTAALAAGVAKASPDRGGSGVTATVVTDIPENMKYEIMSHGGGGWGYMISDPSHAHGLYDPGHTHTLQPVNTRSDGSIRHRQHHPVDFPPKR